MPRTMQKLAASQIGEWVFAGDGRPDPPFQLRRFESEADRVLCTHWQWFSVRSQTDLEVVRAPRGGGGG